MRKTKTVEDYILANSQWEKALTQLRRIILTTELKETVKWGMPTYTIKGKNVVGLVAFKSYVGIWFFNGVFLKDEQDKLVNAQEGKTKAMRQWRFNSLKEIEPNLIKEYVNEAIKNQKEGKEQKPEKHKALIIPQELMHAFAEDSKLKESFNQLSLSKQREFAEYIAEAKRGGTKIKRLEKILPMILANVGLNDKYR